ncbi:hypothetical protein J8V57_19980, partial [Xenorhabdus sp. PB61.4]|uniref:hypothetical protein n=1 Tax=Xenorhabdus sp. PB61.4 TaxID=2788940 RepID=UPI001E36F2C3
DNSNVIFKESNSQTWTTKTLQDESIDISIACLKNRDTQFVISAYLTDFPETKAPPLSAKFISTFVIQVITHPYIYDTGFQAEICFSVKNPDGSGEIITLNPFCNKSYAPDDASQSKCYPYGPVNNDPSSGGIFENYQLTTNSSGFTSTKFTGYYPDKICISASTSSPIKEINSQLIQYRNRYTISMTPSKQGDIKVGDIIDCTVKIWQTSSPHHWKLDDTNVTWSIVHDTTVSMYHPGVITFDPPSGSIELKNNETIGKHGSFSTKATILKLPENISAHAIRIDVNTPQGYNSNQYFGF